MRFGTRAASKLLACLLAGIAALQPACPAICLCPCVARKVDASQIGQDVCSCDHHGHCHATAHTGADCSNTDPNSTQQDGSIFTLAWFLGVHTCTCPSDCDCQLRHSSQSGFLSAARVRIVKQQVASTIAVSSTWPRACEPVLNGLNRPRFRSTLALDVPSCCAVLCRFTI